jgi:putative transposase
MTNLYNVLALPGFDNPLQPSTDFQPLPVWAPSTQGVVGKKRCWCSKTCLELPGTSDQCQLPLRARLGNFPDDSIYDKARWLRDKATEAKRNGPRESKKKTAGTKRTADGASKTSKKPMGEEEEPTDANDPDGMQYLRTRKMLIRFVGTPEQNKQQRRFLSNCMGAARYTYNKALRSIQSRQMTFNKTMLRQRFVAGRTYAAVEARQAEEQRLAQEALEAEAASVAQEFVETLLHAAVDQLRPDYVSSAEEDEVADPMDATATSKAKPQRPKRTSAQRRAQMGFEVGELLGQQPWLANTPMAIRFNAIRDLCKAQQSNESKKRLARDRGENHHWELKPRSGTDPAGWNLQIPHQNIKNVTNEPRPTAKNDCPLGHRREWTRFSPFPAFKSLWGDGFGTLWVSEKVDPNLFCHDMRITLDRRGRFYLCLPIATELPDTVPLSQRRPKALDPGVKGFQHGYAEGEATAYAEGANGGFARIFRECEKIDQLQSKLHDIETHFSDVPSVHERQKSTIRRSMEVCRQRVKGLVDEVHWKVARDLVLKHDTILIPVFKTQEMTQKVKPNGKTRTINSKVARSMLTWAHWRFRQRLIHLALMHGKEVIVVTEEYTTQACGRCGALNTPNDREYRCGRCGLHAHRDVNAARNIMLMRIVQF